MADINENRAGYKQTKVGWVPEEWELTELKNAVAKPIVYGIVQAGPHVQDGVPYIKSSDISGKIIDPNSLQRTSIEIADKYKRSEVYPGDIVFSLRGNIGECQIVPSSLSLANLTQGTARIRVKKVYNADFIKFVLSSYPVLKRILSVSKGSTFKEISLHDLRQIRIPLPPLPEQGRIAAILSTWDAAIGKLDQLIAKKRDLKKGLMQQLLSGQRRFPAFVPEGGTRYKETKVGRVPVEWEYVAFGEVFSFLSTTSYSRNQLTYEETEREIYYIHYGDIHTIYKKPVIDIQLFPKVPKIMDDVSLPNNPNYLEDGDLIIADASEDYEGVGECIEVQILNHHKAISGLHTFAARDKRNKTVKGFRTYLLKNPEVRNALRRIATGSNVYGISKTNLAKFPIIIPSIPEQRRIAAVLSTCDEEIATLEREKEKLAEQKKGLMQQLLTGAVRTKSEVGKRKSESGC